MKAIKRSKTRQTEKTNSKALNGAKEKIMEHFNKLIIDLNATRLKCAELFKENLMYRSYACQKENEIDSLKAEICWLREEYNKN